MADEGTSSLIAQREIRLEKVKKLREMGIDPYPSRGGRTNYSSEIHEDYARFDGKEVTVAGRVMSWREHGQIVFGHLQDQNGRIQLYIKDEVLTKTSSDNQTIGFDSLDLVDVGDIVQAVGKVTKTQKGEISVLVSELRMLTKAIRPLPEKWSGIKDKELIYRQRYLDTIINPEKKERFAKFAQITFAIREFLNNRGFLEIKTPILQPLYGGGLAKPFVTKMNALDVNFYMAISHELYLKRLITAGFENVYNIAGYFRNEGIDRTHNPEFTMLETMSAFNNYEYNMDLIEEMYRYVTNKVFGRSTFKVSGQDVDFSKKWERIQMIDAVKKYTGADFNEIKTLEEAHKVLESKGVDVRPESLGESMVELFKEKVEVELIQPTFVYGHPVEISPLAKRMPSDSRFAERFEIFIGGIEGGDNWTELNDPVELFERFKAQMVKRDGGDDETHPMDIEFVEMMEYGMPPTTGLGPGIERLVMMLTETEYIDDVLFFPILRPAAISEMQKEIYGEENLIGKKSESVEDATYPKINLDDFNKLDLVEIDEAVKEKFPGTTTGYAVIENVKIEKVSVALEAFLKSEMKVVKSKYSDTSAIKQNPNIDAMRKLYKAFGADPNSTLNSSEAITRRIVQGKGLYNINNLVDLYNVTSARFGMPMAAYDLDNIEGKVRLTIADDDEITLIGQSEETDIKDGSLIYKDEKGTVCMNFNYRDSDRTKVTPETKNIIVFVDGAPGVDQSEIKKVLTDLVSRVVHYIGGSVKGFNIV